jgi:hypothetical protein
LSYILIIGNISLNQNILEKGFKDKSPIILMEHFEIQLIYVKQQIIKTKEEIDRLRERIRNETNEYEITILNEILGTVEEIYLDWWHQQEQLQDFIYDQDEGENDYYLK